MSTVFVANESLICAKVESYGEGDEGVDCFDYCSIPRAWLGFGGLGTGGEMPPSLVDLLQSAWTKDAFPVDLVVRKAVTSNVSLGRS